MLSKQIVLFFIFGLTQAANNRTTPPMGYLAYTHFACWLSFDSLTEQLGALNNVNSVDGRNVSLRDSGYDHFVLDDCWQNSERNETGWLEQNPDAFNTTDKSLEDFIRSATDVGPAKNFKFGLTLGSGDKTCRGNPGSYEHEKDDVALLESYQNVTYLKYDNCYGA